MSDEPPDDYFEAADGVIEAARELDEARATHKAAQETVLETFRHQLVLRCYAHFRGT